jgi:hypothetical protein
MQKILRDILILLKLLKKKTEAARRILIRNCFIPSLSMNVNIHRTPCRWIHGHCWCVCLFSCSSSSRGNPGWILQMFLIALPSMYHRVLPDFGFLDFFSSSTRVWTPGLTLARQGLYHLSHSTSPFYLGYFEDRILSLPMLIWTLILLFYASQVARITSISHQCQTQYADI